MKLPDTLPAPAQVVVCDYCLRAGCWNKLVSCVGIAQGNPRRSRTLDAEEVEGLAAESSSFWYPPRKADDTPRSAEELLDVIQYMRTLSGATRLKVRAYGTIIWGIDEDQVDAALAQAWPIEGAA